jgi:hypothetical protein
MFVTVATLVGILVGSVVGIVLAVGQDIGTTNPIRIYRFIREEVR